jgi:hypothetical protein
MKIHTHGPTFLPVLSKSPIDYYDGGAVRMNTEFYSWDTSFGRVNPRLRYSCLQVVFCVNLGTFFKCFWQLGWRLTGVGSTHTECFSDTQHSHYWDGAQIGELKSWRSAGRGARPLQQRQHEVHRHLDDNSQRSQEVSRHGG